MSLFKRKLTREQQEEVLEFAHNFHMICSPCQGAFTEFQSRTSHLYQICRAALQQDVEPDGVSALVAEVLPACDQYARLLASVHERYASLRPPAKWYPKELRRTHDSWGVCLSGERKYLELVIEALQPPRPLAHEPRIGNDKLGLFIGGLNYLSLFEMRLRELLPHDVRSTALLLGIDLSFEDVERITRET